MEVTDLQISNKIIKMFTMSKYLLTFFTDGKQERGDRCTEIEGKCCIVEKTCYICNSYHNFDITTFF